MFDLDRWREILQTISKNKLRTALSGFTIAFAILLFTILFGLGNGLLHSFEKQFKGDASNSIYIYAGKTSKPYKGLQSGRKIQFKNEDYKFIVDNFINNIQYISPLIEKRNIKTRYLTKHSVYTVRAVFPDYQFLESAVIQKGRFINMFDIKKRTKVIAIGKLVEQDLFGQLSALNKNLDLNGISYKVIGVFSDPGGDRDERFIYMPFSSAQQFYSNTKKLDRFGLTYNPKLSSNQAIIFGNKILKKLKIKHKISPKDQSAIRVRNYAEGTKQVGIMLMVLNIIILFIGIGTLIAGVIGIGNMMVYIVKERTKEFGIRKALGATPKSIINLILQESVLITSLAGYMGLIMGVFILKLLGPTLKKYFILNPSVSTGVVVGATIVLILAGVIAGYIPAKRAARIKPIEALNDE